MPRSTSDAPEIGLSEKTRAGVAEILNALLGDEFLLYVKTRNYHWNVVGPQFNDLHKFFESQYEQLDDFVDAVAERARSLGAVALGSMQAFLEHTRLKERDGTPPAAKAMIADLLGDHESIVRALRKDIETTSEKYGDEGTTDFLTGLMEEHEKMAWMLRSFLA